MRVPCPACNGDGFLSYEDRHVENRKEVCGTCKGEGTVPAQTGETPQASARPVTPPSQDLEGLRALSEEATKGPFSVSGMRTSGLSGVTALQVVDSDGSVWAYIPYSDRTVEDHIKSHTDAKLFAKSVNFVRAMFAQNHKVGVILARQQPPHAGGDAVREAAQALLNACVEDMGYGDETGDYPDGDDEPVGWGENGPCAVQFGHMRRLRDALATTPPAPGDGKLVSSEDMADFVTTLAEGITASREAGWSDERIASQIAHGVVMPMLAQAVETAAAERDAATLATPGESDAGPGWRLVPVNPTDEMVAAGWIDKEDVNPDDIYRAMLTAAPASPQTKKG